MRAKSDLGTKLGYAVHARAVTGTLFWVGEGALDSLGESGAVGTFTDASFTTRVDAPLFARSFAPRPGEQESASAVAVGPRSGSGCARYP